MSNIQYKFTTNPLEISSIEVEAFKDFNKVYKGLQDNRGLSAGFKTSMISIAGLCIVGLYLFFSNSNDSTVLNDPDPSIGVHPYENPDPIDVTSIVVTKPKKEPIPKEKNDSREIKDEPQNTNTTESTNQRESGELNAFSPAEPLVGFDSLYRYLSENLVYPPSITDSIEGKVDIQFTISTSGEPENILILKSLGEAFDKEAIRLISKMPKWKPAYADEKAVPTKKRLLLVFKKSPPILETNDQH